MHTKNINICTYKYTVTYYINIQYIVTNITRKNKKVNYSNRGIEEGRGNFKFYNISFGSKEEV